ncbi:hypothetical protein CONPUDRAFT_77905 [Coniophora puteana RWD-64-598 SS2]|uniref:Uncharacterized protein n=1 Tax=Coniophora puteana (strain RWD-64-598) TaxID=741705 RepID=R7SEM2_CONPW|nr:uncharacterized protein CONPUDRAFT_77905 [Coniophora puteana RWD-64-598 SS2]EIW74623.1 hypothetical protein CONPUDRAFT_77905 [Coniophora puteana RWD-64-598 SS2]
MTHGNEITNGDLDPRGLHAVRRAIIMGLLTGVSEAGVLPWWVLGGGALRTWRVYMSKPRDVPHKMKKPRTAYGVPSATRNHRDQEAEQVKSQGPRRPRAPQRIEGQLGPEEGRKSGFRTACTRDLERWRRRRWYQVDERWCNDGLPVERRSARARRCLYPGTLIVPLQVLYKHPRSLIGKNPSVESRIQTIDGAMMSMVLVNGGETESKRNAKVPYDVGDQSETRRNRFDAANADEVIRRPQVFQASERTPQLLLRGSSLAADTYLHEDCFFVFSKPVSLIAQCNDMETEGPTRKWWLDRAPLTRHQHRAEKPSVLSYIIKPRATERPENYAAQVPVAETLQNSLIATSIEWV